MMDESGSDEEPITDEEQWQDENSEYIARLVEAARGSTLHAGAELRSDVREVVLYGVGSPGGKLVSIMDEAPPDVRVVWQEAPYTLQQLLPEVDRVMTRSPDELNSGWPLHDGTGIAFTTTDAALLDADDPQAVLEARFPVSIEYEGPAIPI